MPSSERSTSLSVGADMTAIEIHGLSKRFGDVVAVDELSFAARAGAVTGFLGPNGAGKSTTLRMLLGLVTPTAGTATFDGLPYVQLGDPFRRVGAVLETDAFHPGRRARDHLRVLAVAAGLPLAASTPCSARSTSPMPAAAGSRASRSGCANASASRARCWASRRCSILDEPANGLDPEGVHWLRQFLRGFADGGGTVLVSSHVLAEVAQTVDDVVIIADGRLVTQSSLAELAGRSGSGVRVRTPQAEALRDALAAQGIAAQLVAADALVALETTAEAVGLAAAGAGAVIYEMTPERFNLEELFLELTTAEGASR